MVKRKVWGTIVVLLFVLMAGAFAVWYYMSFLNHPTPSRGVYVQNTIQSKYGGSNYGSLYKAL